MTLEFAFANLSEFFWMKGHGYYVWSSYAITFVVIGIMVVIPQLRRRSFVKALHAKMLRDAAYEQDNAPQNNAEEVNDASGS